MEAGTQTPGPAPVVKGTGCCPPFDPAAWTQSSVTWQQKLFATDHVHCLLHVPVDMGRRVTRNQRLIDAAQARPAQPLMLSIQTSAWGAEIYIEVTRPVPGAHMTTLSGTFSTRVYEGPFQHAGRWIADMQKHMLEQGQPIEKFYLGYTTCPRCAKAYGKNYVIVFAQHAEAARVAGAA